MEFPTSFPKLEGPLHGVLRRAAEGHAFLFACFALSLLGTISAAYPVTAVVVPAALLARRRWSWVALTCAVGSALGATVLVALFHRLGWAQLYAHFPELATHPSWLRVLDWVSAYGIPGLFLIALSPLPQTPALVFFGIVPHAYPGIALAMLLGKAVKYGMFAWAASRFPERFMAR